MKNGFFVGRDTVVAIPTRYGLDGPGIEFRWRSDFPYLSRPAVCPPSLLYSGNPVSFPGLKRPGPGIDHPLHLTPRLKKE